MKQSGSNQKKDGFHMPVDKRSPLQIMRDAARLGTLGLLSEETRKRYLGKVSK